MEVKQLEQNLLLSFGLVKRDVVNAQNGLVQSRLSLQNFEKRLEILERKLGLLLTEKVVQHRVSRPRASRAIARIVRIPKAKKTVKKFVASKTGNKVHVRSCVFAKNILPKRKTFFASRIKALNMGFKACECLKA